MAAIWPQCEPAALCASTITRWKCNHVRPLGELHDRPVDLRRRQLSDLSAPNFIAIFVANFCAYSCQEGSLRPHEA